MQDEIYDIFDKNWQKIGTATWHQVHKRGLLHQVAAALIFKDSAKKEILLQRRKNTMVQDPGLWGSSAGGHIQKGKTPAEAIRKEIKEELFSDQKMPKLTLKKITVYHGHDLPGNYEIVHMFGAIYSGPFSPGKEVAAIKWEKWEKLLKDMKENKRKYSQFFHNMIAEYLKVKH